MSTHVETVIDERPSLSATGTERELNERECRRQIECVLESVGALAFADACFRWFADRPEKFSFIVKGETYPTPVLRCDGKRLFGKCGVEVGREPFTDKPIFKNFAFDLVLSELYPQSYVRLS